MDVFSHGLWTNLAFYKKYRYDLKNRLMAVFFGVMPDLVSFVPSTFYLIFSNSHFPRPGEQIPNTAVFNYALASYDYTHSLAIFTFAFTLVWFLRGRKPYWPMLGWLLHILIDIPTHRGDFFPTPILFPVSDIKFLSGFSWATPWFFILNWTILLGIYGYIIARWYKDRKNAQVTEKT